MARPDLLGPRTGCCKLRGFSALCGGFAQACARGPQRLDARQRVSVAQLRGPFECRRLVSSGREVFASSSSSLPLGPWGCPVGRSVWQTARFAGRYQAPLGFSWARANAALLERALRLATLRRFRRALRFGGIRLKRLCGAFLRGHRFANGPRFVRSGEGPARYASGARDFELCVAPVSARAFACGYALLDDGVTRG